MLKKLDYNSVQIGEVIFTVDEENNLKISGYKSMSFDVDGDLDFNAKKIRMNAEDVFHIESKTHLVEKAPRIDLNPPENDEEYLSKYICEGINMNHEFVVLVNGKIETYNNFDDIPEKIDNVIKFMPVIPAGPHTEEEHKEIEQWSGKLKELMSRETNGV